MNRPAITELYYLSLDALLAIPVDVVSGSVNDALRSYIWAEWRNNAIRDGWDDAKIASYKFLYTHAQVMEDGDIEVAARFLRLNAWKDYARSNGVMLGERGGSPPKFDEYYATVVAEYHPAGEWEKMPFGDRDEAIRLFYEGWDEGSSRKGNDEEDGDE